MDPRGTVLTEVEFTPDVWTDISAYVKSSSVSRGRDTQLEQVQPGTLSAVLRNNDRTFDPSYSQGPYYGYLLPMRRIRQRIVRGGYAIVDGLTLSGNEITDALRTSGPTGDGRPLRVVRNVFEADEVGQALLAAAIDSAVTTITINAWPSQWPTNSAFRIQIDQETLIVTAGFTGTTLTVVRGVAQSWGSAQPAAAHSAGAIVSDYFAPFDTVESKAYSLGGIPSNQATFETTPSGQRAMKLTVHPGDQNDSADATRERVELHWTGGAGDTGERWFYRWSNEFPSDFAANNVGGYYIRQFGPNHAAGNPAIYIRVTSNNKFQLGRNAGVLDTGTFVGTVTGENDFTIPFTTGVRHDFILEVDWELTATGLIRLWHREGSGPWEQLLELTGIITSSSLSGVTPTIKSGGGIYRSADATHTNYLYLSNAAQAASWEDIQFEDVPAGDSSTGIWAAATNILTADTTTWTKIGTVDRVADSAYQFMGAAMTVVDVVGAGDGLELTFAGLTIGLTYTASFWIDRDEVDARFIVFEARNAANSANVASLNIRRHKGLQRATISWVAAEATGRLRIRQTDATNRPVRFWAGRPQLEVGPVATPFAGVSATRAAGRIRAPSSIINATQSWVALRLRPGWAASNEPGGGTGVVRLFQQTVDSNNRITGFYDEPSNEVYLFRKLAGAGTDVHRAASFNAGESVTIVYAWTGTQTKVSFNGSAFTTAANSSIPNLSTIPNVDFGSSVGTSQHFDGDVLWLAAGSGTLTDADAAAFDAFGDGDKPPADTLWGSTATPTFMWSADTDLYWVNSDAFLFSGFVESWTQNWPDRLFQSDTTIQASDAFKVLNLAAQPTSTPNVEGYDDVVNYDKPSFYYRLGEPEGTKVITHVRKKKHHISLGAQTITHTEIHKRRRRVTVADVEGTSGPSGTYKNTPTLGEPGAITGDSDTSVRFTQSQSEYARIGPLDQSDSIDANRLTVECWVKLATVPQASAFAPIVIGPFKTASGNVYSLYNRNDTNKFGFAIASATSVTSTTVAVANTWYHVVGTWDGATARIYVNGVLEDSSASAGPLLTPDANQYIFVGHDDIPGYWDGWVDEVAIYEKALSAARIAAHYTAATRGYSQEATGTRMENAIAASGYALATNLDAGTRDVLPVRQFGQPTLQPIDEAVDVEGGASMFFFSGNGTATFFDRNYQTRHPQSLVTIGDGTDDDVLMEDLTVSHGEELLFNQIRVEAAEGVVQEANDTTSQAPPPTGYYPRTLERSGILFVNDADALEEANDLLALYKDPVQRIRSVVINPGMDESAYTYALLLELGDHVIVNRRPLGGEALTQDSFVERLTHDIDFEHSDWRMTLSMSGMIQVATPAQILFSLALTRTRPRPPARTRLAPVSHTSWAPVLASHPVRLTRTR